MELREGNEVWLVFDWINSKSQASEYFADDPSQASLYDNVIPYINEPNRLSAKEKQKLKEIENEMNELESSELIDSGIFFKS